MTTASDWQTVVGRNWAEHYALTDRSFSGLTQRLLERIELRTAREVLDLGCGAGELSLALARAWPQSRITGLDISDDLADAARHRGGSHGNVRFVVGDAARWAPDGAAPDLLVSRHGVMFFDDPVAAFTHLGGIAAPAAGLVFSCFRDPALNPWASDIARIIGAPPPADPRAPGPFAFADPQYVEAILQAAGWTSIDFEPVDFAYIAGAGADPVGDALAFFRRIGPAAPALRALDPLARARTEAEMSTWLERHHQRGIVAFPAAAWIVTARRG